MNEPSNSSHACDLIELQAGILRSMINNFINTYAGDLHETSFLRVLDAALMVSVATFGPIVAVCGNHQELTQKFSETLQSFVDGMKNDEGAIQ